MKIIESRWRRLEYIIHIHVVGRVKHERGNAIPGFTSQSNKRIKVPVSRSMEHLKRAGMNLKVMNLWNSFLNGRGQD